MVWLDKAYRGARNVFLRWLRALIAWLFRLKAPPGPVTKVKVKVKQMSNVRITWKDPTVRDDGSPLDASEIGRVDVSLRVAGAPDFTLFTSVAPGGQEALVTDIPAGDYEFKIVVLDNQRIPQESQAVIVSVSIEAPLKAAPGPVTEALATVE